MEVQDRYAGQIEELSRKLNGLNARLMAQPEGSAHYERLQSGIVDLESQIHELEEATPELRVLDGQLAQLRGELKWARQDAARALGGGPFALSAGTLGVGLLLLRLAWMTPTWVWVMGLVMAVLSVAAVVYGVWRRRLAEGEMAAIEADIAAVSAQHRKLLPT